MAEFKNELRLRNGVQFKLDLDGNLHMTGATPVCTFNEDDIAKLGVFLGEGGRVMRKQAAEEAKVQEMNRRHRLGLPLDEPKAAG